MTQLLPLFWQLVVLLGHLQVSRKLLCCLLLVSVFTKLLDLQTLMVLRKGVKYSLECFTFLVAE